MNKYFVVCSIIFALLVTPVEASSSEQDQYPPLYAVNSCLAQSLFIGYLAASRDRKIPAKQIQDSILVDQELTTPIALFGLLLTDMVYERVNTSSTELRDSSFKACLSMHGGIFLIEE